jgi:coenzyme F420 hydrogenase subunit beta
MTQKEKTNQAELLSSVIDKGLCTGCGACVELCPYMKNHNADTVALFKCDRETGRCYKYCPRTETQLEDLQKALFEEKDLTDEIGAFRGLYMTRAKDPKIQSKAQHGGTVTALVSLALSEGLISGCVLAEQDEKLLPKSYTAFNQDAVLRASGSKFGNAPPVAEFNRISSLKKDPLGVVATPCQALALAKMKTNPADEDKERMGRLKLVIGLFCGWTLDWRQLQKLVVKAIGDQKILAMDIPPSKHSCMQVTTDKGITEIPIAQVDNCVRECCDYCSDMTAEFADISVGSARSSDGWETDKHWNQVIVRSKAGEELMNMARKKGILEFKDIPDENLEKLKKVSLSKRKWSQSKLSQLKSNLAEEKLEAL